MRAFSQFPDRFGQLALGKMHLPPTLDTRNACAHFIDSIFQRLPLAIIVQHQQRCAALRPATYKSLPTGLVIVDPRRFGGVDVGLNLRSAPSHTAPILLGPMPNGTRLFIGSAEIVDAAGYKYRLVSLSNGVRGYACVVSLDGLSNVILEPGSPPWP